MISMATARSSSISCVERSRISMRLSILCPDPALISGIVAEGDEAGHVFLTDVTAFGGDFGDNVEVGEAHVLHVSFGHAVEALLHAIGKDAGHAKHFGTGFAEHLHHVEHGATGGNKVFDDHDFLAGFEAAFNLVAAAVVLGAGAHITHGQAHDVAHDTGMGDTGGAGTHKHFTFGVVFAHDLGKAVFHLVTHFGGGEGQAVVAVHGALDAAGPGEGFVGAEEHSFDGKKAFGDKLFTRHGRAPYMDKRE